MISFGKSVFKQNQHHEKLKYKCAGGLLHRDVTPEIIN